MSGTTCVCPTGTYATALTCASCDSQCATCRGSTANDCLSCTTGYLLNNQCISRCPAGTTLVNLACLTCDPVCATCLGSTSSCVTCAPSAYF